MGRFDISPEVAEEFRAKLRAGVQPHLSEDVLAVGNFHATGSGTRFGISKLQLGALAHGASALMGQKRAGGLPSTFLLAVTPTKVHAFKYKLRGRDVSVQEEVAAWDRAGLEVSTERLQTTTRVRLQWAGNGEGIVCDQDGMGDNPWADDVVRVLAAA